ncbi:UNVERIFIED_CONTAM: hypothetical protein K2H54_062278 [Gekko kuhli]
MPHLPEKPSPWEDAKAFLASFEQVAEACQWLKDDWATRLLPALSGEAEKAFNSLDVRDKEDYGKVPLEEVAGSISEADEAPPESEQRHPSMSVKEEEDGEAGPLEKPSPWKDAKAFMAAFEEVAKACQWPQEEWATRLLPALSGEAEKAFNSLDVRDREDYGKGPLEEVAGRVSEAGKALSESQQRRPSMHIKEEEGGEAGLLEAEDPVSYLSQNSLDFMTYFST